MAIGNALKKAAGGINSALTSKKKTAALTYNSDIPNKPPVKVNTLSKNPNWPKGTTFH